MITETEDGIVAGQMDAVFILHDPRNDLYHPAIFEEWKPPGVVRDEESLRDVRLVMRYHYKKGCTSMKEARQQIKELRKTVRIHDVCVFDKDPEDWDGEGNKMIVKKNWLEKLRSSGHLNKEEDEDA